MGNVTVKLLPYDRGWPDAFGRLGAEIRAAIAAADVRVHHIGSTAVPGLAAKPILDIQLSVDDWSEFDEIKAGLESIGWDWMPDNDDRRKRYFRLERDGVRVGNLHLRRWGEFSSQASLLFRDYLRAEKSARLRYEGVKRELAESEWETIDHYADAKGDIIWALLREADVWAQGIGWQAGESDA